MGSSPSPARQYATLILMIGMVASGFAAAFALAGNPTMALIVCGAGVIVAVAMLLLGGLVVGASREE